MMHQIQKQYSLYERTVTWTLLALTAVSLIAYCYFLTLSVFAVVERNHAERRIEEEKGRMAELEEAYAHIGRGITLAMAKERGFIEIATPMYLSLEPTSDTVALSLQR